MKLDETAKIVEKIDRAYPKYWEKMDLTDIAKLWDEMLKEAPYDCINKAVNEFILTSKTPPTIADIYQKGASIFQEQQDEKRIEALTK